MLTYLGREHAFTSGFGDIDEPFYDALINMHYRFLEYLRKLPNWQNLHRARFHQRLEMMYRTSNIGWEHGDVVQEVFAELER